jgi:hypothetical protein
MNTYDDVDWQAMGLRLLKHAMNRASLRRWRTPGNLPTGRTLEDVVCDVIARTIETKSPTDFVDEKALENRLKKDIVNKAKDLSDLKENAPDSVDKVSQRVYSQKQVEQVHHIDREVLDELINGALEADEEARQVKDMMVEGYSMDEMAEYMDMTKAQIHNIKNRLKRKIEPIASKYGA